MGRPRKYATHAERQAAYKARKKGDPDPKPVERARTAAVVVQPVRREVAPAAPKNSSCGFPTPRGIKCKICKKVH